ncbi:MAG: DUF3488 and transglutaminase-like domain-containing protein [Vulcanococcus sp.]|uniref:transglutaminase family protein n=1 Tax=Vulcanococcus sp. TaxID=2856995 RepID=UPI0025F53C56|nr:transglutaminase domain-containing protein [Vulcanococcus sp.]MBW0167518.1 DUF3488 and transglutaminase-like domain-containing protein [Vulcanococcus sp.]
MILLRLALLLLWGQLLVSGQLQPLVAIALPSLLLIGGRGAWGSNSTRLPLLTLGLLGAWLATTPLGDRSTWLFSLANLLWLMAALKLLEAGSVASKRRAALVQLIGIGLAGVLSQNLAASLMQAASALLVVAALLSLEAGPERLQGLIRRSLALLAVLLPVVLLAFLLLPRLPALWSLPGNSVGKSGLSEQLRPGELASLVQSGGLAARVELPGGLPTPEQRYWRVLVHQQFDGHGWTGVVPPALLEQTEDTEGAVIQRWLVEPSGLPWRPWSGTGLPAVAAELDLTRAGALWAGQAGAERQLYAIHSTSSAERWRFAAPTSLDLAFPQGSNPQLEALGARWGREGSTAEQRLQLAQAWFERQGFSYSLEPGQLPAWAPLDAFLFERRVGFCEHYAASFSALMRAAGVPARVVVGYQGGRWQTPIAGTPYLQLEQSDAHAWSEIWLEGKGWVEVDPTGWIAPERIRQSLAASLNASERQRLTSTAPPHWIQALADQWEGLDTRWQVWVMQFDSSSQSALLPRWLQGQWQGLAAVLGIGLSLGAAVVVVLTLEPSTPKHDPLRQALERCLQPLAQMGLQPQSGETLQQFCRRVWTQEPGLEPVLMALLSSYNQARFSTEPSAKGPSLREIKKQLWRYAHRPKA